MTRTVKHNDPPTHSSAAHGQGHHASAKGIQTDEPERSERQGYQKPDNIPKYFGKSGIPGTDPTKISKSGAGQGNWGKPGDELEDFEEYASLRKRRPSNTQMTPQDFTTKFELPDEEPVEK